MRAEFDRIATGFDKMPTLSVGAAATAVIVNPTGDGLTNTVGALSLAADFTTAGGAITLTAIAPVNLTLPGSDGTLATLAGSETLSNKTFGSNVALGTPVSGNASNLTGTAPGLTVGTATNATTASTATLATALATPRAIYGNNFDGSAALGQIIASTYGGTGNGFLKFAGPATAEKTYTGPDANCTLLTTAAAVTVAQGGTGLTTLTANSVILGNGTSTPGFAAPSTSGNVLTSNGTVWASAAPPASSVDYAQRTQTVISGSPLSITFSGIADEDVIVSFEDVKTTSSTDQLLLEVSTDGSNWHSVGATPSSFSTSSGYTTVFGTGLTRGTATFFFGEVRPTSESSSAAAATSGYYIALGTQVTHMRFSTAHGAVTLASGTVTRSGR